jgi:hypothetical protein
VRAFASPPPGADSPTVVQAALDTVAGPGPGIVVVGDEEGSVVVDDSAAGSLLDVEEDVVPDPSEVEDGGSVAVLGVKVLGCTVLGAAVEGPSSLPMTR